MKNQVIKCLNEEHGKQIIEYWKSLGFNTRNYIGEIENAYYGIHNDKFSMYYSLPPNTEIIELPTINPLPEYWYIKITEENAEVINKWKQKVNPNSDHAKDCNFVNEDGVRGLALGREEITFYQFKKYVLKQDDMKEEIIGYKLKEEFVQCAQAATKIMNAIWHNDKYFVTFGPLIQKLEKAKVLDLWFEPVYKAKYSLPKINGYDGEYFCELNQIKYGCKIISVKTLRELIGIGLDCITIDAYVINRHQIQQILDFVDNK